MYIVVSNTYCVLFLFCLSSSCVPYFASFSGFSIFECPFGILKRLFTVLLMLSVCILITVFHCVSLFFLATWWSLYIELRFDVFCHVLVYNDWSLKMFFFLRPRPGNSTENCLNHYWYMRVSVIVFNATFNNTSVISRRSVLLVEETGISGKIYRSVGSHWQSL